MSDLPIESLVPEIVSTLQKNHELVLEAPPGAGKTTRVPLALLEADILPDKILMFEPRRMAARNVAQRMAGLLGERVGQRVGYRIRQESKVSAQTKIEIVTGGVLNRLLQADPALEAYSLVIFDEFHERSLDSDLALALCLQGRELFRDVDNPLKLLIMSATLGGMSFEKLLPGVNTLTSLGRRFPVDIFYGAASFKKNASSYRKPFDELIQNVSNAVEQALVQHSGDVLVFLPGEREILAVQSALRNKISGDVFVSPLFGRLSLAQQQQAIAPITQNSGYKRKVVLSTDIAETSLTIEGVTVVIDCGLRREAVFDPRTAMTRLNTVSISQASADQRAGRAGRLSAGYCYRLWPREKVLAVQNKAEMEQADLSSVALQILAWGVNSPKELNWLTEPPRAAYSQALDLLLQLEAIEHKNDQVFLTEMGRAMAQVPSHPRLAHMMIRGAELGLSREAAGLAALLSESGRHLFRGSNIESHLEEVFGKERKPLYSGIYQQRDQFLKLLNSKAPAEPARAQSSLGLLLAFAYPDRIARRKETQASYLLSLGRAAKLQDQALNKYEWLVVAELGGSKGKTEDVIYSAAPLDDAYFESHLANLCVEREMMLWGEKEQRFIAERRWQIGAITYKAVAIKTISSEKKQQALCHFIREKGLNILPWNEEQKQWCARINFLREYCEDYTTENEWPDVSEQGLLETVEFWLAPFLATVNTLNDFKKLDLDSALSGLLPWEATKALEEWAPSHWSVPSGSKIKIDYLQNPPVLAVKLQEMFGAEETPKIACGKVALLIHLLSPARRPLQVTQDLAHFWRNGYDQVKKEMKGRYPKHPWPNDPLSAQATRFTNKRNR